METKQKFPAHFRSPLSLSEIKNQLARLNVMQANSLNKMLCNCKLINERLFEKTNFFRVISVSYLQPFCTFAKYLYTGWEEGQIGVDFRGEVAHLRC